jgi:DNA-directed RNA polymerase subunit RPC12/RpoP
MILSCEKCGTSEAKLDINADKVICTNCNGDVAVTSFAKQMMKDRRDILEKSDIVLPPNGILVVCDNQQCQKSFSAEVDRNDSSVRCPYCKTVAKISDITKNLLASNGIFVGYTKEYFEQEGKESVNPKDIKSDGNDPLVAAIEGKVHAPDVTAEEESKITDMFTQAPPIEVLERIQNVDPKVAAKSAEKAPSFVRRSEG